MHEENAFIQSDVNISIWFNLGSNSGPSASKAGVPLHYRTICIPTDPTWGRSPKVDKTLP